MNETKDGLRKTLIRTRLSLPASARQQKVVVITKELKNILPWSSIASVHIFESIEALGEVDTKEFINYLKKINPQLKFFYPRKLKGTWQDVDENNNPAIGINYDVIIVPVLGFDSSLNRLGYGGGYYDRLLSGNKGALSIGLSFESGHVAKVPTEPRDIRLKCVISEEQVYNS